MTILYQIKLFDSIRERMNSALIRITSFLCQKNGLSPKLEVEHRIASRQKVLPRINKNWSAGIIHLQMPKLKVAEAEQAK